MTFRIGTILVPIAPPRARGERRSRGQTQLAERATGYYWGEPRLKPYVNERCWQAEASRRPSRALARRFLP